VVATGSPPPGVPVAAGTSGASGAVLMVPPLW
jgi:hypothetical protein